MTLALAAREHEVLQLLQMECVELLRWGRKGIIEGAAVW